MQDNSSALRHTQILTLTSYVAQLENGENEAIEFLFVSVRFGNSLVGLNRKDVFIMYKRKH